MTETGWRPPPRPEWVRRLNRMGRNLGPTAIVPLDEASLLAAATGATGLDDFGPDEWREPFRILLADMAHEADLTLTGRLLARFDLVRSLTARLRMAEAERRHPEILAQPVVAPIIITGLGRTGTTILHELLGLDPALRAPRGRELRYPALPPGAAGGDSVDAAADIDFWVDVVPEFLAMHESTSEGPDEDSAGMVHDFVSPVWSACHRAPNFDAALRGANARATRFHRRLLQHLQFLEPGRALVKGPTHLSMLPEFFAEYPDARVIQTHRDPLKVLASTADMIATLRWQRSDNVDYDEYARQITFGYPLLLDYVAGLRRGGAVPDDHFVDVRYAHLLQDPLGTIAGIYAQLGLELTDETAGRMRAHLEARPKGRHGAREYRFEDLGVGEDDMREKFASYMDRFQVPREAL
jgi:hypothetical protein